MRPVPFEYVAARSVDEALDALTGDARVLAGGQSLLPLLNARAVRTSRLVDVNAAGLGLLRRRGGVLEIGATVRQAALERSALVREHWPLLAQAVGHVGSPATRSRGTVGGSVAHADPRAQLPAALAALDARFVHRGPLLVAIEVAPLPPGARTGYAEFSRGGFPDAGAAVVLAPDHAAVARLGGVRAPQAERALREGASAREAAALAAEGIDGAHRRALVADATRRALEQAGCA
ncbi:MAG TPA: FAD binding domain-containing protein [Solirubrobacter sp.]|nr:FAD binding domain-containing protein [Solirubrobacter sp.]